MSNHASRNRTPAHGWRRAVVANGLRYEPPSHPLAYSRHARIKRSNQRRLAALVEAHDAREREDAVMGFRS